MELHDENPFKIKSVANAAFKVDKLPYPIASKTLAEIEQVDGLGKSIAGKIWEIIESNSLLDLSELLNKTPPGIVEMMRIKGLGPKKILIIWKG
jgi:DNA polymerase (family 10)